MRQFIHERKDFKDLILSLSAESKIDPQLVEKDYWIMQALWGLNELGFDYELKGGTSLSKGWKCIDRFSEDIDIYIHPAEGSKVPVGRNQSKSSHVEARRLFFDSLVGQIQIKGFESVGRDHAFDDTEKMRNAGIRLSYSNQFGKIEGLKDGILLEVGFDQTTPYERIAISSWLMDKALSVKLDVFDNRAVGVKCYVPEYTFVEKLQTISTKFRQQQLDGRMPINFMRHYYDLFQLLRLSRVQKFIGSKEYFEHKERRFRSGDQKDIRKNEAFILSVDETRILYQTSFEKTRNLYFRRQPTFDEMMEVIKNAEIP